MVRTILGGRVVASGAIPVLIVGDLVALIGFAALGELQHAGTVTAVLETAVQFGVGWYVVATLVGAYGPGALDSWRRAAALGAGTWALGAVVGGLVRVATEPGAGLTVVFLLVTAGVGAVIFGVWRGIAARILGPLEG